MSFNFFNLEESRQDEDMDNTEKLAITDITALIVKFIIQYNIC
jgi:hypothetical protein